MRHAGLIGGLGAGAWSAVVALVMPGLGKLFDLHAFNSAFTLVALIPIAGFCLWHVLNRYNLHST